MFIVEIRQNVDAVRRGGLERDNQIQVEFRPSEPRRTLLIVRAINIPLLPE